MIQIVTSLFILRLLGTKSRETFQDMQAFWHSFYIETIFSWQEKLMLHGCCDLVWDSYEDKHD